jgi:hypothetical protein
VPGPIIQARPPRLAGLAVTGAVEILDGVGALDRMIHRSEARPAVFWISGVSGMDGLPEEIRLKYGRVFV